jgi:hypothetical protein
MVYINRVPTGPVDWFTSLARFWTRRAPFFLNEARLDRDLVCFPRLLAGAGATRFHVFRSLSTRVLTQQRAFLYRNARIAPPPPPLSEHLILVYVKESSSGRARSMANANALLAALDTELGKTRHTFNGRPVRVVSGEVWKGGFAKELAQLAAASVMFAPPGGICFSGLFLRPQASMVLLDWWCDGKRSCRFAQEANVWAKFPDRYMYYYTLDRDEIRGTNDVRWSGPGVYHLRPEKFVKSVMDALDMADLRLRGGEGELDLAADGPADGAVY